MAAVQWNFNIYAFGIGTIQSDMPPGPLKINGKATRPMPLHQTCQLTMWNFIRQDWYIVSTTYMSGKTDTLSIQHICLLVQCHSAKRAAYICACWPCVAATNTSAVQTCLLVECCCKMEACCTVATQSACLPIFCLSILHVCCRCAFLSAIPAGMVSHCQPCLLVWCITIGHAFWCCASL